MPDKLINLIEKTEKQKTIYKPLLFRLKTEKEFIRFKNLLTSESNLLVFDELRGQVKELIKLRNPNKNFTSEEMEEAINKYFEHKDPYKEGVWVYYPWSNKVVHLLDEEEFIEVRTNRNFYKITPEERDILARKKVGIIGLSVGQSVSVTMAMERSFGEIRLADFDILELSNYNRIRTQLSNLGISKAISVAREIAEIDPYIKVKCFPEGLNEENMDSFFCEGGTLDLLIDECDGLDIKILARVKAKALRIPVVMEASDRCMLDVERFDLEPDRPLLHGLIDGLDVQKLKTLRTNEEKVPYLLAMIGIDTISSRLKASMLEIEQTITTWPQLASAVALGGGLTADVCRRIFINEFTDSGRYYMDVEQIVGNKDKKSSTIIESKGFEDAYLSKEELSELAQSTNTSNHPNQVTIEPADIKELVSFALLAPSPGNNQPWQWYYDNGNLYLFLNKKRSSASSDFNNLFSFISLGASVENLILKAQEKGWNIDMNEFPLGKDSPLVAKFSFYSTTVEHAEKNDYKNLCAYIPLRCTNRNGGSKEKITPSVIDALTSLQHSAPGAIIKIVDDPSTLSELREVIKTCERIRFLHPELHADFFEKEIRWTRQSAESSRDGMDIRTLELSATDQAGMRVAKEVETIALLNKWKKGKGFEKISGKNLEAASAIGFIALPKHSASSYLLGGRLVERMWLTATSHQLAIQPLMAPILMFLKLKHNALAGLPEHLKTELYNAREKYIKLLNIDENIAEIFLFRLAIAEPPSARSLRLPLDKLLLIK
jgi:molybdopterin/thiamine biosynthesis adenylyltransferase